VVEAMPDRLPDVDRHRQHGQPRADIGVDIFLGARGAFEVDIELAVVHALGMLIKLGAPGAAADRTDFRHLGDDPLGDEAKAVRFRQRNPRVVLERDQQRAFVERRQEAARHRQP
jgi:hypothetical protein